jgi:hypothetical protein
METGKNITTFKGIQNSTGYASELFHAVQFDQERKRVYV